MEEDILGRGGAPGTKASQRVRPWTPEGLGAPAQPSRRRAVAACTGQAQGAGVRQEKTLLLETPRKTSLRKCLGTVTGSGSGSCGNERRESSRGRIQTREKPGPTPGRELTGRELASYWAQERSA